MNGCSADQLLQVASEWGQAKAEAAQAKAVGDKNKQKDIGLIIRSLKQEMTELGTCSAMLNCSGLLLFVRSIVEQSCRSRLHGREHGRRVHL